MFFLTPLFLAVCFIWYIWQFDDLRPAIGIIAHTLFLVATLSSFFERGLYDAVIVFGIWLFLAIGHWAFIKYDD